MPRLLSLALLLSLLGLLVACGSTVTPAPTPVPTAPPAPTPAPTAAPTSQGAVALLTAAPWQWTVVLQTDGTQSSLDDPASYTVNFGADGTLAVKADCNQAGGTYTLGPDGALTIALGPTTAAECGDASRGREFLALLAAAINYQSEPGQLVLQLNPESGGVAMLFAPAQ